MGVKEIDSENTTNSPLRDPRTTEIDMSQSACWDSMHKWMEATLLEPGTAPFSFIYDGRISGDFLSDWDFTTTKEPLDETRIQQILTYTDHKTGLEVRCEVTTFSDHPAVEWVLKLKNSGEYDTPIISNIQAIDTTLTDEPSECKLHYASGVREGVAAGADDFRPKTQLLPPNSSFDVSSLHGRSSWGESLPFFNVEMSKKGIMLGIGWTGQWVANFSRNSQSLAVRSGMELTHLKLYPGEEIRTPKILLLFWKGHRIYGQNLLRRIILAHYHPKKDGVPLTVPLLASSAGLYHEAFNATEQNQIDYASKFAPLGVEYLWMDVGWHVTKPASTHIGPADPQRFPNGLRPLSDRLNNMNMGLLVWMAPEFQGGGTWMERDHPNLFLTLKDNEVADLPYFKILNFGDSRALEMITGYISNFIQEEGIGIYRQDGPIGANLSYPDQRPYPNKQPLQWWRDADAPDRQGITEIRYVEGLYWFWDELLRRNPDLIIDMCGGGATRIDLEAMSRCVYLWRSDHNHPGFEPNGYQSHTYGISQWAPSTAIASGYPDTYSFRSSMNNGISVAWNPYQPEIAQRWPLAFPVNQKEPYKLETVARKTVDDKEKVGYVTNEPFPWETAQYLIQEFRRIRHLFHGDFYPLTPYSLDDDIWLAYQFHREDLCQGVVLAFRRPECSTQSANLKLWGVSSEANYEIHFEDCGRRQILLGKEMIEGLDIIIESQPGSALITYHQCR